MSDEIPRYDTEKAFRMANRKRPVPDEIPADDGLTSADAPPAGYLERLAREADQRGHLLRVKWITYGKHLEMVARGLVDDEAVAALMMALGTEDAPLSEERAKAALADVSTVLADLEDAEFDGAGCSPEEDGWLRKKAREREAQQSDEIPEGEIVWMESRVGGPGRPVKVVAFYRGREVSATASTSEEARAAARDLLMSDKTVTDR